ncbi:MAG: hypothetical protein GOP50_07930 [Candidatus Heimdallarchaeota archaeon]|nr:hypothetical protein [Candidatus Heimdallarchaeota archaeon]
MKKKIIVTSLTLLFVTLVLSSCTISADYPTGDLGYSDDIVAGNEYEWTVKTLDSGGDNMSYVGEDDFYIGDQTLEQGDKIKLVVLEDPDTAVDDWYDIYVDGVKSLYPTSDFLDFFSYLYGFGSTFISPVSYTNATGTYELYQQLYEELLENAYNYSESYTTSIYTEIYELTSGYKLSGDVLSMEMYARMYSSNGTHHVELEGTMEISVNINTGLLGNMKYFIDMDVLGEIGFTYFLLESKYANVPYDWVFGILGLTFVGVVMVLINKKRR